MTGSVTLTIGIPTYNGSAYIRSALDSVIKQVTGGLEARVDILVSDNASSDGTPDIIKTYQVTHPGVHINYSRNDVNLGYDRNVDMLFRKASGQYVWMLADDDALSDGALLYILNLLDQYSPSLKTILVNFDKYDSKLEQVVDRVEIPEDIYCHNPEIFLRNAKAKYNLVSALIMNKAAWNAEDLSYGIGSNFIHVYALFRILLLGDSYIVHQALVKAREGSENFGTSGDALLSIALSSGALICSMKKMGHTPEVTRWLLSDVRQYTYNTILIAKLLGIKNKLPVVKKLISIHNGAALWIKYIPIIFFPDALFKKLYFIKKGISSKTRGIERKLKKWIKKSN